MTKTKESKTDDIEFLKEMLWRLKKGRQEKDPTHLDMVETMIEDWLHELRK